MSKLQKCQELMLKLCGPATANLVAKTMAEEDCVQRCRLKITMLLGPGKAKEFDNII